MHKYIEERRSECTSLGGFSEVIFACDHALSHARHVSLAHVLACLYFNISNDPLPRVSGVFKAPLLGLVVLLLLFIEGLPQLNLLGLLVTPVSELVLGGRSPLLLQQ
jgi:hypothetical protein